MNPEDNDEPKKDIGSLIGLIVVFILGFAMIAFILWPVLYPPIQ